jgi:ABC-type uncharacterized transport system substrate-binding protein
MAIRVGRREFIFTLGSAALAPAARAQQGKRSRVVFLHPYAENDPEVLVRIVAFSQGLEALGWKESHNIRVEHRYCGGDLGRIQAYTTEAVRSAPDLIAASSTPIVAALKQATDTVPIVFSVLNDPLGQGFVASLSRPGGNITGFTFVDFPLIGKWLELLKEIAPAIRRVTLMFNPATTPFYPSFLREFAPAHLSLAVKLSASPVHDDSDMEATIRAFAAEPDGGLIAAPDVFINTRRHTVMALTEQLRLPVIFSFRQFATEGALIAYGPDTADIVRRSASYVDRILRGEKAANLPVQAPTKYELVINLKTARALGLDVPSQLQQLANEVIE